MSFGGDLKKFQKDALDKYVKVRRMASLDLFSSVVMETPVDQGVLRNNWFAELGRGSRETTDEPDKSGMGTVARINMRLQGATELQDIFLTNNLPYAYPIEFDGHSGKAPQGMVRVNTARWDQIVKVCVRKVTSGF